MKARFLDGRTIQVQDQSVHDFICISDAHWERRDGELVEVPAPSMPLALISDAELEAMDARTLTAHYDPDTRLEIRALVAEVRMLRDKMELHESEERTAVVKFLREANETETDWAAGAIERGEHRT